MHNVLDAFAAEAKRKRIAAGYTQRKLTEKLNMSVRTIMDLENCISNPKSETILLIARELNISIDSILFPDLASGTVSKSIIDFFSGKTENEIQKYISLCQQADQFKNDH